MKYLATVLLLFMSLLTSGKLYAKLQGQARLDSMLSQLHEQQNDDTNTVNLLSALSQGYKAQLPDEGLKYGIQELKLATKIGWQKGIAKANNSIGLCFKSKKEYFKSVDYFQKSLKIFTEIDDKKSASSVLSELGLAYMAVYDYPKAVEYFTQLVAIGEEIGKNIELANYYNTLGNGYMMGGNYPQAQNSYYKALKVCEDLGDSGETKMVVISNLGNLNFFANNYPTAMDYYRRYLRLSEEFADTFYIADGLANVCEVLKTLEDNDTSLSFCFKARKRMQYYHDKHYITLITRCISELYAKEKNYPFSIYFGQKAQVMGYTINDISEIEYTAKVIGNSYYLWATDTLFNAKKIIDSVQVEPGKKLKVTLSAPGRSACLDSAIKYLEMAKLSSSEHKKTDILLDSYGGLAKVYQLKGNYKKALENFQFYTVMKDSLFSKENEKKLVQQQMQYDFDKKEVVGRTELLKQKREKQFLMAGSCLMLLVVSGLFVSRRIVKKEKDISENLLLNILPAEVAKELKTKGSAEARLIDEVTVLFTDFKGFTQLSEKLSPKELVGEINTCFSAFDNIMIKHGVEKIKTIGDAYMAAGGLPVPNSTHAEDVIKAALEIQAFMNRHRAEREAAGQLFFEIRIGIHTGSVVAGIVGLKKFAYDIWGDTVNIASRMESSGAVGKVNISQTTYELVKDKFSCEYRGEVEAKGKGAMSMYFVS